MNDAQVQELFSALTGGEVRRLSMAELVNPFGAAWKNYRRAKKSITDWNLKVSGCSGSPARWPFAMLSMVACDWQQGCTRAEDLGMPRDC